MSRSQAGTSGSEVAVLATAAPREHDVDFEALADHVRADERERILVSVRGVRASLVREYEAIVIDDVISRIIAAIGASNPLSHRRAIEERPRGRHAAPEPEAPAQPVETNGYARTRPMPSPRVVAMTPVAPVHQMSSGPIAVPVNGTPDADDIAPPTSRRRMFRRRPRQEEPAR